MEENTRGVITRMSRGRCKRGMGGTYTHGASRDPGQIGDMVRDWSANHETGVPQLSRGVGKVGEVGDKHRAGKANRAGAAHAVKGRREQTRRVEGETGQAARRRGQTMVHGVERGQRD